MVSEADLAINFLNCSIIDAARAAGVAGATTAGWRALGDRPTVGVSVEHGEQARGVFALAVMAGDGRVGVLHRTQGIKAGTAIQADVFVERHRQS